MNFAPGGSGFGMQVHVLAQRPHFGLLVDTRRARLHLQIQPKMRLAWNAYLAQTSQSTCASRCTGPGFTFGRSGYRNRKRHLIFIAKIHQRPERQPLGIGNCIGPAVIPGGSVQVICGGSPESPALIQ